jgi:carboxyl-terminal processing protease
MSSPRSSKSVTPTQRIVAVAQRTPLITRFGALLLAIFIAGGAYNAGYSAGSTHAPTPSAGTTAQGAIDLSRFNEVLKIILDQHVGPSTNEALVDGAIKGMISSLDDPYTVYLTASEMKAMVDGLSGSFEGIGAVIETLDAQGVVCKEISATCELVVRSLIAGSPALKAGLAAGDHIVAVDGASLLGLTVDSAILKVRGPKGTSVTLTIVRGSASPKPLPIVRDVITVPAVESKALHTSDGAPVGYIHLSEFSDNAGVQFHTALQALVTSGDTRIIVDIRDNPGGYLSAALQIISEFVGDGVAYMEEDSKGQRTITNVQSGGLATDPKIRVVLLVNGGSASASEIFAGALQDRGRATLVGQTTFGKGVAQVFVDISGGYGLKVTVAKWLTPNGRWIHKIGLTPDVALPVPAAGVTTDAVLEKALTLLK